MLQDMAAIDSIVDEKDSDGAKKIALSDKSKQAIIAV
jgi:hypothetical protein